jgi:hypothetical protein
MIDDRSSLLSHLSGDSGDDDFDDDYEGDDDEGN